MHRHERLARPRKTLVQRARRMVPLLTLSLLMSLGKAHATPDHRPHASIRVAPGGWGSTDMDALRLVLQSVADEFGRHFPDRQLGPLEVTPGSGGPIVLYERGRGGAYVVKLSARDGRWFQFVYQFAHELCHIYSNFDRKRDARGRITTTNQWFEESLCETAALFTLRQLARTWVEAPPGTLQARHARDLQAYADYFLRESHRKLPGGQSLRGWFKVHEHDLADNPYHRQRNELVANVLLPYFEENPDNWEAIAFLNSDADSAGLVFEQYLGQWLQACPEERKAVVERIMTAFGVGRGAVTIAAAGGAVQR